MEIEKSQGQYDLDKMQMMATVASTANGLEVKGNTFKVNALTGCPDMVLFACEQIEAQRCSYNMALQFALEEIDECDIKYFLTLWNEGSWKEIAKEFPDFDLTTTGQSDKDGNLISGTFCV